MPVGDKYFKIALAKLSESLFVLCFVQVEYKQHCLRGRPFDPEGGGMANLIGTDYLFSSRARPENLFPGKPSTEYFFSTVQNFYEKAKKKVKRGGG